MEDIASLRQRLEELEALLNLIDALRPDLPEVELYELALQSFCEFAQYDAGSLWIYSGASYQARAWHGLDRQRSALMPQAVLEEGEFQHMLAECTVQAGVHWLACPLADSIPAPLRCPAAEGHTAIVVLAFTERIGFVALDSARPAPGDTAIELLSRLGDRVGVALDAARVFHARQQTIDELHRLMDEQQVLQATVLELSAPLLPLLPGVLVLPLVGAIDQGRAEHILEAELNEIIRERAQVVLVDITGTSIVDTNVAMQLVRSAEAAQLLGCQTILVGVRPEIAQTLVGLGVDLRGIHTYATLADGLQRALRLVRRKLVAMPG